MIFFQLEEALKHSLNSHPCLIYIKQGEEGDDSAEEVVSETS